LYDFGPRRNTGWWDSELYRKEFRRTIAFFSKEFRQKKPAPAEALVVWDTESFYEVENLNSKTCEKGLDAAAEDIQRCGVNTDHAYLFELPRLDLGPYRAILFMNAWKLSPEQRRYIRDSVAAGRRTLIWNYLSGYSDGQRLGKEKTEELTGILLDKTVPPDTVKWQSGDFTFTNAEHIEPFFTIADTTTETLGVLAGIAVPVIARKKLKNHTSVYAGVPLHGSDIFRRLFAAAGCLILNEKNDFTFAKNGYILLHSKEQGTRTLQLQNGNRVEVALPAPATKLLDAESGVEIFK
jgi:hypothetical protein